MGGCGGEERVGGGQREDGRDREAASGGRTGGRGGGSGQLGGPCGDGGVKGRGLGGGEEEGALVCGRGGQPGGYGGEAGVGCEGRGPGGGGVLAGAHCGRVAGGEGDGLAAAGAAAVLELVDLVCEVLEISDGADEDLELELFFARGLWLWPGALRVELILVVLVVLVRLGVGMALVLGGDEDAQGGEGIVDFCAACLLDKRVVYFALCLTGGTREGAWSATAALWGGDVGVGRIGEGRAGGHVVGGGGVWAGALCSAGGIAGSGVEVHVGCGCDGAEGGHGALGASEQIYLRYFRARVPTCPASPPIGRHTARVSQSQDHSHRAPLSCSQILPAQPPRRQHRSARPPFPTPPTAHPISTLAARPGRV